MKPILLLFFCSLAATTFANTFDHDSVGVEEVDGQVFILHKVETRETLYSVSRRYNVSIYKIIESNPPTEYGLEVGQVIRIPYIKKVEKEAKPEPAISTPTAISSQKDITHTVTAKETLFSISRQYGVTVDDLKSWNNLSSNNLDVGQQLIVKKTERQVRADTGRSEKKGYRTHVVKQSETLYSISRLYEVSVDDLKSWNKLPSNEISIGQELIVNIGSEHGNASEQAKDSSIEKKIDKQTVRMDSALAARNSARQENSSNKQIKESNSSMEESADFGEIVESGTAALIEGSDNTRKYLALHRTAKVGTILRVHNEMNGQEVFVRVLGKLPDTGVNKNVVIRISKSAYDRLGAIDPKFRVKISYIP